MIDKPIGVYINWAAYDELSDNVELTEELAMTQLEHMVRLRRQGVALDYYLMDAFWYARDGAYRTWRRPHWPDGPDRWLRACAENGIKPALWVATNAMWCQLDPPPKWEDSLIGRRLTCCMFHGGFLADFLDVLHLWYGRGVRLFKFDFVDLSAAPPELERTMLPSEIRRANSQALSAGLKSFRAKHPEVVLIAYNGLEEVGSQANTSQMVRKVIDPAWLEVFDSIYCGDPRPADVPCMRFWRAKDVYCDHQVRVYEHSGVPLARIDNSGFMVGTTGTCYHRRTQAWKGMLLLSMARGGWVHTCYGNLDLIDDDKAAWFARAQSLYMPLLAQGRVFTFGGWPGLGEPYGFAATQPAGAVLTVLNPSQAAVELQLPRTRYADARLLFTDAGFTPRLDARSITLGPEQMAVIGLGCYADDRYDLGVQDDVVIPRRIEPVAATFSEEGPRSICATLASPPSGILRFIVRLRDASGLALRLSGGAPPKGTSMGQLITLSAQQQSKPVAVGVEYDKAIWSGLSWGVGELAAGSFQPGQPLTLRAVVNRPVEVKLSGEVYKVEY